jgi:CRP-like cAMP-binding protein
VATSAARGLVQIPGRAARLSTRAFQRLLAEDAGLRDLSLRYTVALFEQAAQSVACNARHELMERCAKWLLMTRDRVGGQEFPLTHEFLATMLGVRRATVTIAAGMLQTAGMITYSRGRIAIRNAAALEGAACECYRVIRHRYSQLLDDTASASAGR